MKTMKTTMTMLTTVGAMMTLCALALQMPAQAQVVGSTDNGSDRVSYPQQRDPLDQGGVSSSVPTDLPSGLGRIRVVNRTHRFIRVYANHAFVGTVAPHSDLWCRAVEGRYFMRATAFSRYDHTESRWEPYRLHVEAGAVSTWTLMY